MTDLNSIAQLPSFVTLDKFLNVFLPQSLLRKKKESNNMNLVTFL